MHVESDPAPELPQLKNATEFLTFIIRAVNSIEDLDSLLRVLLDGAITLVGACRGAVMVPDASGELHFRVARGLQRSELTEQTFQVSRTLTSQVMQTRRPILTDNASHEVASGSAVSFHLRSIMVAPLAAGGRVLGVVYLDNPFDSGVFGEEDLNLVVTLAEQAAVALKRAALQEEKDRLQGFLARYVSPQVARELVGNQNSPTLEGKAANVTIVFADISGFTQLAEKLSPRDVMQLLNEHFSRMVTSIFAYGGTVKQFAGDEVMAIFGAPVAQIDHCARAIKSAIAMQEANYHWQVRRHKKGFPTFGLKVGLHTGKVVVGSVGSQDRLEYAAVGDVVNTASRVMHLCSHYGRSSCILATKEVVLAAQGVAHTELMGTERVKGKSTTVEVYSITPLEWAQQKSKNS